MRNFHSLVLSAAWAFAGIALIAMPQSVAAQDRSYDGLFGGSAINANRPKSLDLSTSFAGGYERNNAAAEARRTSSFEQTGGYELVTADLGFSRRTRSRFQLWESAGFDTDQT